MALSTYDSWARKSRRATIRIYSGSPDWPLAICFALLRLDPLHDAHEINPRQLSNQHSASRILPILCPQLGARRAKRQQSQFEGPAALVGGRQPSSTGRRPPAITGAVCATHYRTRRIGV